MGDVFTSWLASQGVHTGKTEIWCFPTTGRGIRATDEIETGETILSIPSRLLITTRVAYASPLGLLYSRLPTPEAVLAAYLAVESRDPHSFWSHYVGSLPRSFSSAIFFKAEDLLSLENPHAQERIRLSQANADQLLGQSLAILQEGGVHNVDMETLRWAYGAVQSRSVYMAVDLRAGDKAALVPLGDMFNFATDHVLLTYGAHSNLDLLEHYGFVLPSNPNDSVDLGPHAQHLLSSLHHPPGGAGPHVASRADPLASFKTTVIHDNNLHTDVWVVWPGMWCYNLRTLLRLTFLSPRHKPRYFATLQDQVVDPDAERSSQQWLVDTCTHILQSYSCTDQADSEALEDASLSDCARCAILWRREQKRMLLHCIDNAFDAA